MPSLDVVAEVLGNTAATSTADTAEAGGPEDAGHDDARGAGN